MVYTLLDCVKHPMQIHGHNIKGKDLQSLFNLLISNVGSSSGQARLLPLAIDVPPLFLISLLFATSV